MSTDPRKLGGGIVGPGGPYDENAVLVDTRNAVILEGTEVAIVGAVRKGVLDEKPIMSLVMLGRINKTDERVQVLYLMNHDGAAALVTELIGLAARAGWGEEFKDDVLARLAALT